MLSLFSEDDLSQLETTLGPAKCGKCGLRNRCNSPHMAPSGEGKKKILVIAEAPGAEEDARGTQLIGDAGKHLYTALKAHGVDLHEDCRKINAVNCRPPKNRTPSPQEIIACRPVLFEEIREHPPRMILLLGNAAVHSLIGARFSGKLHGITKWRGFHIPDKSTGAWISPTWHPSFLLRNSKDAALNVLWHRDLAAAIENMRKETVFPDYKACVKTIRTEDEAHKFLTWLVKKKPPLISVDWESTGLKPHAEGHKIVTGAISWDEGKCCAFRMFPSLAEPMRRLFTDKDVKTATQNARMEMLWAKVCLGFWMRNVRWDTMLVSHILDCRPKITGLKFQAYVRYGEADYNASVDRLLKGKNEKEHGANAFNSLVKESVVNRHLNDLLLYNGLDALFTRMLAVDQARELGVKL